MHQAPATPPEATPLDARRRTAPARGVVLAALVALLLLGGINLVVKSYWLDEAFAFDTASRSFTGMVSQSIHFENQTPLYFGLLHGWLRIASSVWAARLLSLLCALGAVFLLARAVRPRTATSVGATAVLVALGPATLYAASEMRGYALALVALAGGLAAFARIWLDDEPPSTWHWVAWGACNLLATLSLYYMGFALAGQVVAGWVLGRHRARLVAVTALLGLLLAPWVLVVLEQAARQAPEPYSPNASKGTLWSLASAAFPAPFAERRVVQLAWAAALAGLVAFRLGRGRPTRAELAFALIAVFAFAGPWLVRTLGIAQVNPRHWLAVAPSVSLCLASCAAAMPGRGPRAAMLAVALLFTLGGTISLERNLSPTDWRRLARQVEARRRPGEPMLFFPSRGALIYRPYQRVPGSRHGMPENIVLDRYPLDPQLVVAADRDVDSALDRAGVALDRSFWLLVEAESEPLGLAVLERYVSERCQPDERAVATGLWAVRLSCSSRAATHPQLAPMHDSNPNPQ